MGMFTGSRSTDVSTAHRSKYSFLSLTRGAIFPCAAGTIPVSLSLNSPPLPPFPNSSDPQPPPPDHHVITDDDHIALTGQASCVDYAANFCGRFTCSPGKRRCDTPTAPLGQRWTLENYPTGPPPTDPQPEYPPASGGRQLHPQGDVTRCVYTGNLKSAGPGVAGIV